VSLDLVVVPKELDGDEKTVLALYYEEAPGGEEFAGRLLSFAESVRVLLEADGRWPWTGPIQVEGSHAVLHPAHEYWDEVIAELPRLADEQSLVVYDPQASEFLGVEGYKIDLSRSWDYLVIHPDSYPRPWKPDDVKNRPLHTMRARLDGEIECKDRIDGFIAAVEATFPHRDWAMRHSPSAALLTIPLSDWKRVTRAARPLVEEHNLAAWVPDGNPMPSPQLKGVKIEFFVDWYDGPLSGVAAHAGETYWFEADRNWNPERDPPLFLYPITAEELATERDLQRLFENKAQGKPVEEWPPVLREGARDLSTKYRIRGSIGWFADSR
jgi:hypothetical protein